ncbi:MAG: GldG family protein [Synergistaceae bacterium]|jgi:ABC-2 type transport system permease protein|nr:GldG family protein [Synergistaceae bacterium]
MKNAADRLSRNQPSRNPRSGKIRFYAETAVWCAVVLALAVSVTMFAYRLPWRADLTGQRIFTLSESSREILGDLASPVKIGAVYPAGNVNPMLQSLLGEYASASEMVEIRFIDAEDDPSSLAAYDIGDVRAVRNGMVIVNANGRYRVLDERDMFVSGPEGSRFFGERVITGAIRYVASRELPKVYFVAGHGEGDSGSVFAQAARLISDSGCETGELVLLEHESVPDDAAILVFASPLDDLTEMEAGILIKYLEGGGAMLILADPILGNSGDMPLLSAITGIYGIALVNNLVIEPDSSHRMSSNKAYLIPRYAEHDITAQLAADKKLVILPLCRGVSVTEDLSSDVERKALLFSSDSSFARMDTRLASDTIAPSDVTGPVPLAYAATKASSTPGGKKSRVVVIGDSDFAAKDNIAVQANSDLLVNAVNWLLGDREGELAAGKTINSDVMMIRGRDFIRLTVICCAALPLFFFVCAWVVRRRGKNR